MTGRTPVVEQHHPVPVTVVVLTLDEAELLPRCLSQLDWAAEVLVVDSGSTDGTQELARRLGARVLEQPWLGWPGQRNAGAAAATFDWVLVVEADEVVDHELRASIRAALAAGPDPRDGFSVDRRNELMGTLLGRSQRTSKVREFVRLYHRGESRWDPEMLVHEQVRVPGETRLLAGTLIHWRRQTLTEQVERIARYAPVESRELARRGVRPAGARLVAGLVVLPWLRFGWLYVLRGGFRSGAAGYVNARLRATADLLRYAALLEAERGPTPLHPPGYGPPVTEPTSLHATTPTAAYGTPAN